MWTWEFKEWRRGSEPNIRICGGLSVMPGSADPIFLCGLMVKVLGLELLTGRLRLEASLELVHGRITHS